jgi:hypothetical protein
MSWAPATIAALLIAYAVVSRRLERLNVSGAMFFTTAGLLAGPCSACWTCGYAVSRSSCWPRSR